MNDTIRERYSELVKELNHHISLYYAGTPEISDTQYDLLYRELLDIEKEFPDEVDETSPTQKVGSNANTGFTKAKHLIRMFSLSNVFNIIELQKFYKRFSGLRHQFGTQDVDQYVLQYKMDGLSLELDYVDGTLARAVTRGDGITGDDVTDNAYTINNIPKRIITKNKIIIHGEVVVHKADFYAINQDLEKCGQKTFSNCRNYTVGSLKQKDPNITKSRLLKFYAWDLFIPGKPLTHHEKIDILIKLGFNTPSSTQCSSINEMISTINEIARIRSTLAFDIDGVVIKQDNPEYRKVIGWNSHEPLWATAWKFLADGAVSKINRINWYVGKTGRMIPTASIDPISVNGITISEVTLNNATYVDKNKLGIDGKIRVIRSGDVIPKITEILDPGKYNGLPNKCPYCDGDLSEDGVHIRCTNPNCSEILKSLLKYIFSKDLLNIKGVGDRIVEDLVDKHVVTSLIDIFNILDAGDSGINQSLLDTIVTRTRNVNLLEFLMMLGITGMGRAVAGKLVMEISDLDDLISILNSEKEMKLLPINDGVKKNIVEWYSRDTNKEFLNNVRKLNLEFQ